MGSEAGNLELSGLLRRAGASVNSGESASLALAELADDLRAERARPSVFDGAMDGRGSYAAEGGIIIPAARSRGGVPARRLMPGCSRSHRVSRLRSHELQLAPVTVDMPVGVEVGIVGDDVLVVAVRPGVVV